MFRLYALTALHHLQNTRAAPGVYEVRVPRRSGTIFAKAAGAQPNQRWVTLHPRGRGSDDYVRVLVKIHPDGTGHVMSGSGKLRGLKLNRLQPEKWEQNAKERKAAKAETKKKEAAEKKAKEKSDLQRASEDPEFAQEHAKRKVEEEAFRDEKGEQLKKIHGQIRERHLKQISLAAELGLPGWEDVDPQVLQDPQGLKDEKVQKALSAMGITPDMLEDDPQAMTQAKGGAGMVVGRVQRKLTSGLKRLKRDMIKELAENHELRDSVLGEGGQVDAGEAFAKKPGGGLGFQKKTRERAEEEGISEADAKKQARDLAEKRLKTLEEIDPERAQHARTAGETMRGMHKVAGALKSVGEGSGPKLETNLDPVKVREHAEKVKEFLKVSGEVERLEQSLRQYNQDTEDITQAIQNRTPGSFDVDVTMDDEDFVTDLKTSVQEAAKLDLTRSFFDELDMEDQGLGWGDTSKAMLGKAAHAGYAHLNAALLTATGHSGLDRSVLDTLGLEAAAKLAAYRLQASLTPEELDAVREGLAAHHDETTIQAMQDALEKAQRAKAAALELDLPDVSDAASLVAAKELNNQRKDYLESAINELGSALGGMEAGAALNLALAQGVGKSINVRFNPQTDTKSVLMGLAALGLDEGDDYSAQKTIEGNALHVTLTEVGMEKLSPPGRPDELAHAARLESIREGELDEDDWLPAGFTSYPANIHNDPARKDPLATPPGFGEGTAPGEALGDFVSSRLADGHKPSDILREVGSIDFVLSHVPEAQREGYLESLNDLFPTQGEDGKLRDVDQDPELRKRFEGMARAFVAKNHPDDADLHSQSIQPDAPHTRKAAYLALTEDPRTQIAFTPPGELGHEETAALRSYFHTEIAGVDHKGRDKAAFDKAVKDLGPEPQRMGESMFGTAAVTPEWSEWDAKRRAVTEQHAGPTAWAEFVSGMRGLKPAYEAVQEHMKGRVAERFSKYHSNLSGGAELRLGVEAHRHAERFGVATDKDKRAEQLAQESSQMAGLRDRDRGKFAGEGKGSVVEKLRQKLKQGVAFEQTQSALFGAPPSQANSKPDAPAVKDTFKERYSLGSRAEGELASILPYAKGGLKAGDGGLSIYPKVTMGAGTKYVTQQRAIKFAKQAKKSVMGLGMGSGKTGISIATFTELHNEGKAKKALFITPSVVRNQFGEEMARFTEPGRYKWHAEEGSFEDRLKAYRDPDTHMNVVTHQSFRDDAVKLLGNHYGHKTAEETVAQLEATSPQERRKMVREAFASQGVESLLDYIAIDEMHGFLNRDGKPDSVMAMIGDAAFQEAKYGQLASGTPIKNDSSEAYDLLRKVAPERWEGREDEFKRRYGVDMKVSQEAFKREVNRYVFASKVPSGVDRKTVWGAEGEDGVHAPIDLHPKQQTRLEGVGTAFERARQARREGKADVEALKVLSPNSFEGVPEERHQEVAEGLNRSLGTLRFSAQARVLDASPAHENSKIQHVLKIAKAKKGEGQAGVVFAHSLSAVSEIAKALQADGHRVAVVTGADSSEEKAKKRQMFHPDTGKPEADIMVLSDAAATGMNLQRGQYLVNYDLPLVHATHAQRNARIDRIGQKQDVEVHNLLTSSKFDQDAQRRLERKELLQSIFDSDWETLDDSGLAKHIALARSSQGMNA